MARYTARRIKDWEIFRRTEKGLIPARPDSYTGLYGFLHRAKYAFGVLIGKYDALDWE